MAIVQISKIQQRSGNLVDLPQLDEAELGFASDAKLMYVGVADPPENVEVLTSYSNISFSQLEGAYGNLDIDPLTAQEGQVLTYDGNNWVNRGGDSGGLINLGDVANLKIEGGGIDYVLTTDGTGNLSWTAKGTIVAFIQTVSQANPGIVTTTEDNFLTEGAEITITNPKGMTELAGGVYYANILTSNTFALYSDTGLTTTVDTTGFSEYSFTSVTDTTAGTNDITVGDATLFNVNDPVKFIGTTFGGIEANVTYYILSASGVTITVSETLGGSEVALTTASGTCDVYATGGRVVSQVGGGTGTAAEGSNLSVQFNNNNLLDGDPDLTWNFVTNVLNVVGNVNANNITVNSLISTNLTGTLTATSSAQPNVTSLGNGTNVTIAGNLNPNANITYDLGNSTNRWGNLYLASLTIGDSNITTTGNGISIDSISSIVNGNSNVVITANGNINLSVSGNANILRVTGTGVNVAGYANITGNANIGNVGAINGVFTNVSGNGYTISLINGANVTGQVPNALVAGTVYTAAQPNITSVGTLTSLVVSGNGFFGNVFANSGTIMASILKGEGGNISNITASNITGTVANATHACTANTVTNSAQSNITSVGTLISLAVTGNITAGNVYANAGIIAALNLKGEGGNISNIQGANVVGQVANALVAGTVYTAAQPNITSVGTLTSLTVTGNTSTGGIKTDNYYYANGVSISFAGSYSNSNVQAYLPTYNGNVGGGTATFYGTTLTTGSNATAGTLTGNWSLSAGSRLQATYADLAEYYAADKAYIPGTVLEFGGEQEVTLAGIESNRVAGVVSSEPAYVMNGAIQCDYPVVIALIGRIPVRVFGHVSKGDLLVSAGNGLAKTTVLPPKIGTVIGKAIQNKWSDGEGVIEVMVGRT